MHVYHNATHTTMHVLTLSADGSLFAEYIYSFNPKINSRRRFESVLYKVVPTP
jgi:hypothetical protein